MGNIQTAITILEREITSIHTVSEWAEHMNFSSVDYFSRKIREQFGKSPKSLIVETKLTRIKTCLKESNDEIYFCIARELGFANDAALYKFVKRHTGKCLGSLKRESEKGV